MSVVTTNHIQHTQEEHSRKMENGGHNIAGDGGDLGPSAQRKLKHKKSAAGEGSEKKKVKLDGKHKESSNHVHKIKKEHTPNKAGHTPIKAVIKKSSISPEKKIKAENYDNGDDVPLGDKVKVKTDSYKIKKNSDGMTLKLKKEKPDDAVKKEISKNDKSPKKEHHHDKKKKEKEVKVKKEKVKKEVDDSDDEKPLSARVDKSKTPTSKKPTSNGNSVSKDRKRKKSVNEDNDSEVDEYQPLAKAQKKVPVKKEKEGSAKKIIKKKETASPAAKKKKVPVKDEKEVKDEKKKKKKEPEQETWKWWEETPLPDGVKWLTLSHVGPCFPPAYQRIPASVKFYYDKKHIVLSEKAEEVAGFYAKMLDHEYTSKKVFNDNFFGDWRKQMTPEERSIITDLKKCNFKEMFEYFTLKNEERKNMTKEEKLVIKKQNEEIMEEYGFCIMDKHKQRVGNFKIEPPGLFRGRGDHPKQGKLKLRVQPEEVSINIGADAEIPKAPEGHKWKSVSHDNKVTWLACWIENIQGSYKYVMLNPTSRLKGEKDWQKYETARKLKNSVHKIQAEYQQDWKSKEMRLRQRGVALYFIDKLALRAGHEKDDDTADTVGCCSLRVEHIKLHEEYDDKEFVVEFDFLGKDSIRYTNFVPVEKRVFKNLQIFMDGKQPSDDLFDRLTTQMLNKYLNEKMEGLTAKVFRTYNASNTLQEQLNKLTQESDSVMEKVLTYNRANRAVAILCNHQRAAPKTFEKSMSNLQNKISDKRKLIKETKKELKDLKAKAKDSKTEKNLSAAEKKKLQVQRLEEQLLKLEISATDKEENKEIALGTSKLNYLDPRISIGWCKKNEVPIEKIYNKTQREKFAWAIDMTEDDFQF